MSVYSSCASSYVKFTKKSCWQTFKLKVYFNIAYLTLLSSDVTWRRHSWQMSKSEGMLYAQDWEHYVVNYTICALNWISCISLQKFHNGFILAFILCSLLLKKYIYFGILQISPYGLIGFYSEIFSESSAVCYCFWDLINMTRLRLLKELNEFKVRSYFLSKRKHKQMGDFSRILKQNLSNKNPIIQY